MKMHVLHALCIYSCHSRSEARLSDVTSITREQTCRDTVSCEDAQADATRMALGEVLRSLVSQDVKIPVSAG